MDDKGMGIGEKVNAGQNLLRAFGKPLSHLVAEGVGQRYLDSPMDNLWAYGFLLAFAVLGQSELLLCVGLPLAVVGQMMHKLKPAKVPSFSIGTCIFDRWAGPGKGWNIAGLLAMGGGVLLAQEDKAAGLYLGLAGLGLVTTVMAARGRNEAMQADLDDGLIEAQSRARRARPFQRR